MWIAFEQCRMQILFTGTLKNTEKEQVHEKNIFLPTLTDTYVGAIC